MLYEVVAISNSEALRKWSVRVEAKSSEEAVGKGWDRIIAYGDRHPDAVQPEFLEAYPVIR